MPQTINLGSLQLKFLQSKEDTAGSLDMFEMTLQPNARMPIPHYHDRWDETIYGLTGTTCWRIDGKDIDLVPAKPSSSNAACSMVSQTAPPNRQPACAPSARACLALNIFKDMAELLSAGAPDPAKMKRNDVALRADPRAAILRQGHTCEWHFFRHGVRAC